jgi:hypothetical protein
VGAYQTAAELADEAGDDRADFARMKAAALGRRVPKLRIVVPESMRDLPGLRVDCDGKRIDPSKWGTDMPTDPGTHVCQIEAHGKQAHKKRVELEAHNAITSITMPRPGDAVSEEEASSQKKPSGPSVPVWPLVVGGVGLTLLGVGAGFGIDGFAAKRSLAKQCFDDYKCPPGVDPSAENWRKDRGLAVLIGAGGAGLIAVGIAVVGLAKSSKPTDVKPRSGRAFVLEAKIGNVKVSPLFSPRGGGVLVEGAAW